MSVPLQRGGGRPGPPALLALPRTARFVAERWNRLREWGANDVATVERHTSMAVNPVDWVAT